jgi:hypothetical protein
VKRLKSDAYRLEAALWVKRLTDRLPHYGEWNLKKIMEEVERILRRNRLANRTR